MNETIMTFLVLGSLFGLVSIMVMTKLMILTMTIPKDESEEDNIETEITRYVGVGAVSLPLCPICYAIGFLMHYVR